MQANQTSVIWTVVIAAVVLLIVSLFIAGGINTNLKLVGEKLDGLDVDEQAIADSVLEGIEVPEYPEFPEYMITEKEYETDLMEDEAETLALDEIDSKDFREFLKEGINAEILAINSSDQDDNEQYGLKIDSYKDIEDAYSIDVENVIVYYDNKTAIVEIEFKIKYVLDEDEDLVGKARVTITYGVSELVVEDDFEDAEVDEDLTVANKIYLYRNLV